MLQYWNIDLAGKTQQIESKLSVFDFMVFYCWQNATLPVKLAPEPQTRTAMSVQKAGKRTTRKPALVRGEHL